MALTSIVGVQHGLALSFGVATEDARRVSRDIARTQLRFETKSVNEYIERAGTGEKPLEPMPAHGGAEVDAAAGHQTGMSMAAAWGQTATAAITLWRRNGADPSALPRITVDTPAIEHRIERHAVTQSLDAYNDEVRHAWKRLALDDSGDDSEEGLPYGWRHTTFRVWSAVIDRKTCKHCFALDGEMVPVGKEFSGDSTSPLHPFCRCQELAVVVPEFAQRKLPGVQIDYQQLKADVQDYFRTVEPGALGRSHIGDYLHQAVIGARARTSPETLLTKLHSRVSQGYRR